MAYSLSLEDCTTSSLCYSMCLNGSWTHDETGRTIKLAAVLQHCLCHIAWWAIVQSRQILLILTTWDITLFCVCVITSGHNQEAAAEADAIREQQLKLAKWAKLIIFRITWVIWIIYLFTAVRLYTWFAHSTLIEMLIKQPFPVHIRIPRQPAETSGGMLVHCDNNRQLYSRTGNKHIVTSKTHCD